MDNSRLTFLFYRYINQRCTNAEKTEFLNFVSDPRYDNRIQELIDQLWLEAGDVRMPPDHSELMLRHIVGDENVAAVADKASGSWPWLRIAASLLLLALCGSAAFYLGTNLTFDESAAVPVESYPVQQPRYVKLPDGSSVILNEGSHLEYGDFFNGATRQVSLAGEAFFDITHDSERQFIVHTGKLMTTVLGTAFNIRAYPDQSDIIVTVTRGKVKVSDDKKVLGIINPHQQITFNRLHESADQKVVDSHRVIAWMEKDIFFDDITIADAVEQLQKRFGVAITFANEKITTCRFTATFVKGEDLEQILQILCDFNNATLTGNTSGGFIIQGGECPL